MGRLSGFTGPADYEGVGSAAIREKAPVSAGEVRAETREDRCVRLLSEHDGALRRLATSYERDPSRRQDLVQDIWLAVWQALCPAGDEPDFAGATVLKPWLIPTTYGFRYAAVLIDQR